MANVITIIAAIVLVLHGLIHLMGTTVYMKLGSIEGLAYKTTLLGERWDVGERGIWVYGVLWVVPAAGFVLAAVAMLAGWEWWRTWLLAVTLLSLVLTLLDFSRGLRRYRRQSCHPGPARPGTAHDRLVWRVNGLFTTEPLYAHVP